MIMTIFIIMMVSLLRVHARVIIKIIIVTVLVTVIIMMIIITNADLVT